MYKLIFLALFNLMIVSTTSAEPFFLQPKPQQQPSANKETSYRATIKTPAEISAEVSQSIAQQQTAFDKDFNEKMGRLKQQIKAPSNPTAQPTDTQLPETSQPPAHSSDSSLQPTTVAAPTPPSRKDIYTGFGSKPDNTTNSGTIVPQPQAPSKTPQNSGGGNWNIRY